jgi:PTH1 family peptidyl-tRNA hydrolase
MRLPEDRLQLMLSLVLGLGNIGERYKNSRHNLGFRVVEQLLGPDVRNVSSESGEYRWAEKEIATAKIVLAMPTTYMNRSGQAARVLLQRNDLSPSQMLVVVDDIYLPLGKIRIRA